MKKVIKIISLISILFLFPLVVKANTINKIDMDIYVDKNGTAHVTETWSANLTQGTEGYKPYYNLGNANITNFRVSENGRTYTYNDYKENVVIANKNLNDTIVATASELGMQDKLHIGMLTTMDVYGPYIDYDRVLNRIPTEYKDKILGEEMEAYALIHIANSMNRSATAMATVADSKFSNVVMSIEDRQKSLDDMIVLALESIIK